ncbi:hypothetical protein ACOME3_006990 [Neoechinorhynchus agilis]
MGCLQEDIYIDDLMNFTLSTENVKPSEMRYVFESMGMNKAGRDFAWSTIKQNMTYLLEIFSYEDLISDILDPALSRFASSSMVNEIKELLDNYGLDVQTLKVQQLFDQIMNNEYIVKHSADDLKDYLSRINT